VLTEAKSERRASTASAGNGAMTEGGPQPELSIVMPCLNEAETLEACICMAQTFIATRGVATEIVVADNGSTDGSQDIARRCGARVVNVPVRGYGAALYHGSLAARGRYVIMGDSDASYDFANLMPFVQKLREGYDLVMGNRFQGGIRPGAMPWKNRYIGNPVLSSIGKLFFRCPASDFHCGIRGYSLDAFKRMDLRTTGMEFASEMVIKATLKGMKVAEVPTTLSPDGRSRPPHLRPWRDGWRHLRFMLLYSPRWLFLVPGLLLMVIGLAVGAWLATGDKRVAGVTLGVHTMLYAAFAVLIGFQAIAFAAFSKVFAISEGLLPEDPRLTQVFKVVTLEVGLIVGSVLLVGGLIGSIVAVAQWGASDFGPLDPARMLRGVIPSGLVLTLGLQTILASFFMSILGLRTRKLS